MYNDNLMILIPKEMKEQIKEKAKSEYKTVSDYVRNLIVKDLENTIDSKWKILYNIIVEVSIKEVNINMSFWRAYFNTKNSILAY